MLLNLLRVEEADPESMILKSLAQYQSERSLPVLQERLQVSTTKFDGIVTPVYTNEH